MTTIDFDFLEKNFYYFRLEDHPKKIYSVILADFENRISIDEFFNIYGRKLKANNPDVVATYFCSAYGWLLSGFHYILSFSDTSLNLSLSNIELQVYYDEEHNYCGICFRLLDTHGVFVSDRHGALEELYSNHVVPLLNLFHQATNVRIKDLYGQLANGLYHGHDKSLAIALSSEEIKKVEVDFSFVTKELKPSIFNLTKNPLDINFRMIDSPYEDDKLIRMRPSCCLYYQTEGATAKCYSCPRMSDEERVEMKKGMQKL
ncbi:(2Fe-2S)-binding protein [Anaerobacillus sp. CMMVII]|uniref:(2Fe-2S)-binding protein n=1 Tax=Anaerobacillus sp. CMMVII TaxID=2755588 RepID=UPI0021B81D85|nr:(2Fe-2S)-binding protein [Anaerobacillus sp. CMMVII]MCT8137083.1 (2Fe-2S)-binding protein [Anaerobacillus sp. CMMVII]